MFSDVRNWLCRVRGHISYFLHTHTVGLRTSPPSQNTSFPLRQEDSLSLPRRPTPSSRSDVFRKVKSQPPFSRSRVFRKVKGQPRRKKQLPRRATFQGSQQGVVTSQETRHSLRENPGEPKSAQEGKPKKPLDTFSTAPVPSPAPTHSTRYLVVEFCSCQKNDFQSGSGAFKAKGVIFLQT